MLHRGTNNTELKYVGIMVVLSTLFQLIVSEQGWKDIIFVIQFIFVELFLILSFQDLSRNLNNRVVELRRLNNLTQATNMRLIKDVVSLKSVLKKPPGAHRETLHENTSRVVIDAMKSNAPAKTGRKLIAKRNRNSRTKPYVVNKVSNVTKPVVIKKQEPIYMRMEASTADQSCQNSPARRDEEIKTTESITLLSDAHDQAVESMIKDQQYFCTRKVINGQAVYERLCLNCSAVMEQKNKPIFSKICQSCKPIRGQDITHYKRLSKFDNLLEFYCGCAMCFLSEEPPCLQEYCALCTVPRLTRKLTKERIPVGERKPVVTYEEWNGID